MTSTSTSTATASSSSTPSVSTSLSNTKAVKRLSKEFSQFVSQPPPVPYCTAELVQDSLFLWHLTLSGPPSTPYEGGRFVCELKIPDVYPMKPPVVRFITPIYHVNVSMKAGGAICQELISKDWSPMLRIADVVDRLYDMLQRPHPETPLEPEIGDQLQQQPNKYKQTAQQWTKKHAMQQGNT